MNLFSKKIWKNHTLYDFLFQQLKKIFIFVSNLLTSSIYRAGRTSES
jgi:hypothetical protein